MSGGSGPDGGKVVIETRGLSRVYKQGEVEVPALRAVDFTVRAGEFLALAGPSGSGKSTLLNLVGVLDTPTGGSVQVAGKDVSRLSRSAAAKFRLGHIGFVFQAYNLLPVLTAYENAEYTLMLQGVARDARKEKVMPLMERVGIADLAERRPHELSGGQQQRVAVVRALAGNPALVLADEPTANLDSATADSLLALLEQLNREDHVTFVFASHDAQMLSRARRIVHLRDGRIEQDERREAHA